MKNEPRNRSIQLVCVAWAKHCANTIIFSPWAIQYLIERYNRTFVTRDFRSEVFVDSFTISLLYFIFIFFLSYIVRAINLYQITYSRWHFYYRHANTNISIQRSHMRAHTLLTHSHTLKCTRCLGRSVCQSMGISCQRSPLASESWEQEQTWQLSMLLSHRSGHTTQQNGKWMEHAACSLPYTMDTTYITL